VLFCDSRDDVERERRQLKALLSRHVDGIIVNGRRTEPRAPLPGPLWVPVVYAFCASADGADCSVVPDEAGGAAQAIDHLASSGRRRIAHVTGPRRHRSAAVRARAARARARAAGIRLVGDACFGTWSEQWGRAAAAALVSDVADLDAVFCGSDQIARGVVDGLRAAGRRIPDDVAVVGFDNWDAMALGCEPQLTTVDLNIGEIGRRAARYLLDAIDGIPHPGTTVVEATLVVRGSAP
jgi:LacI family transcriptional regulator